MFVISVVMRTVVRWVGLLVIPLDILVLILVLIYLYGLVISLIVLLFAFSSRLFRLRGILDLDSLQNKIGAAKVAVFIQIIAKTSHRRIPGRLLIVLLKKTFQPELIITPISDYVVVSLQHFTETVAKSLEIIGIPMIHNNFVRFTPNVNQ
ncbi:MAG: hypothetical protein K0R67_1587 [Paenibacillus sp.]|nr:hypothetical protein [Paenibacillus sp.]